MKTNETKLETQSLRGSGKWLLGGGLAAAFAATLCCIGPLVAASLGFGVFAAAGFFYDMRPLFLGLAILLVAGAWIWDWRERKPCETGCNRRSRFGLSVITVVALLLAASPYILESWAEGTSGTGIHNTTTNNELVGLAVWDVDLEGLDCPTCTPGLQRAFVGMDGVERAEVTYRPQKAIVYYDPDRVKIERFREIVEEFGYGVIK